jgi:putative membrane protein
VKSVSPADVATGVAAGLAGGLVAAWAMNQVSPALGKLGQLLRPSPDSEPAGSEQPRDGPGAAGGESVSSTVKVARGMSTRLIGRELPHRTEAAAGNAVHYAFGATVGALYGAAAEMFPAATAGRGLLFGGIVFAAADETALPLLGLSRPPTAYPPSTHALAATGHAVYGLTTEFVRQLVRRALS